MEADDWAEGTAANRAAESGDELSSVMKGERSEEEEGTESQVGANREKF